MVLSLRPSAVAPFRRARFLALATIGLIVGHTAVYLATFGPSYHEAMAATGHGYWLTFALLALVAAGVPLAAMLIGLGRLWLALHGRGATNRRVAGRAPSGVHGQAVERVSAAAVLRSAVRMAAVIVVGYTLQENLEQALAGQAPAGLWVLDPPLVLPVLVSIGALLAVAGTWLRWREVTLRRRLSASPPPPARVITHDGGVLARWRDLGAAGHSLWLGALPSGRAPPVGAAA